MKMPGHALNEHGASPSCLSDEVFEALVGVLSVASETEVSEDLLVALQAMQAARPDVPELAIALAHRHLIAGDLQPARETLESAASASPRHPFVGALLALTLHAQGDSDWRLRAYEVESAPHDDLSESILASLRADPTVQ